MTFLEGVKSYWPLLAALTTGTVAWGQQQEKISTLERTVVRMQLQDEKIQAVKEQGISNQVEIRHLQSEVRDLRNEVKEQTRYLRALVEASPKARKAVE